MPEDLVKQVEGARGKRTRNATPGPELDAYVQAFLATLDPTVTGKYGENIKARLTSGLNGEPIPDWDQAAGFAKMQDKEYKSAAECYETIQKHVTLRHNDNAGKCTSKLLGDAFPAYDSIICLDAATGKELWRNDFPGAFAMGMGFNYWGASATPAISGGRCYAQGSAGFYCLSMKDGSVLWKTNTEFSHSSPLVMNGVAYSMAPALTA